MANYEWVRELENDPEFWREAAAVEFLMELSDRMALLKISRADLAGLMGASRAYISKALRGEANFSLLTLAKFAMAVGGTIHVHIAERGMATEWVDSPMGQPAGAATTAYVRDERTTAAAGSITINGTAIVISPNVTVCSNARPADDRHPE